MAALVTAVGFTSCSNDDLDTNQYNKSGVNILAFGPMPITRGETMRVTSGLRSDAHHPWRDHARNRYRV